MTDTDKLVHFTSSRFGDISVSEEKIIRVPEGIIGFREQTRYALLDPSGGESIFLWLQAVDHPDLAFIITDPAVFIEDYRISTDETDLERIDALKKSSPALFVIVTVPQDNPDNVSANLLAPLLYFEEDNTLYQIVLEETEWSLRHPLAQKQDSDEPTEPPSEQLPDSGDNGEVD